MDPDSYSSDGSENMACSDSEEDVATYDDDFGIGSALDQENYISLEANEEQKFMQSTSLSVQELDNLMTTTVTDVSAFLQITPGIATTLLKQFDWNKEIVLEKCFDGGTNSCLERCQSFSQSGKPQTSGEVGDCDVCYSEGILTGLSCGHLFCEDCLKEYIATKIVSDNVLQIQCLATDCKVEMGEDQVASYVEQCAQNVRWTFAKLRTDGFVGNNKYLQWCPGIDCGKALKVTSLERKPVKCSSCMAEFCFGCTKTWHAPVDCKHLKLWEKKCSDDSETCNWMNANTRDCPKCGVAIEKNGGCNFMNCTNSSCRAPFCWTCMSELSRSHVTHSCNRYEDKDRDKESARSSLQRYLHHYNRYMNHQKSLGFENQLHEKIAEKVKEIQLGVNDKVEQYTGQAASWVELQFLTKAVDVLGECRRTLMYTYAFAFYLQKDNQSFIFENNQQDLENATEHLSKALEQDLFDEEQNFNDVKGTIQGKMSYVAKRRLVLLDHVNDGDRMGYLKYEN